MISFFSSGTPSSSVFMSANLKGSRFDGLDLWADRRRKHHGRGSSWSGPVSAQVTGHAQAIPTAVSVISFFSSGTKENDGDDFWSSLLLIVLT